MTYTREVKICRSLRLTGRPASPTWSVRSRLVTDHVSKEVDGIPRVTSKAWSFGLHTKTCSALHTHSCIK